MIITTNEQGLRIELHGREQLVALRAKVEVPRASIKDIRFEPKFQDWRKWQVRMPGGALPRLLLAGSYWTEEGWDFLYVKRPHGFLKPVVDDVLVIETDQNRYCRVILTLDAAEAGQIVKWWQTKPAAKTKTKSKATAKPVEAKPKKFAKLKSKLKKPKRKKS